jgi:hypothetical protein
VVHLGGKQSSTQELRSGLDETLGQDMAFHFVLSIDVEIIAAYRLSAMSSNSSLEIRQLRMVFFSEPLALTSMRGSARRR